MPGAEQVSVRIPTEVLARVDAEAYRRRITKAAGRPSRSGVIASLVAAALQPELKPESQS